MFIVVFNLFSVTWKIAEIDALNIKAGIDWSVSDNSSSFFAARNANKKNTYDLRPSVLPFSQLSGEEING